MSLYTKKGDGGKSSPDGKKSLDKSSLVFEVLGEIDNLTCTLGFLQNSGIQHIRKNIASIQEDLLSLGTVISGLGKYSAPESYWNKRIEYFENLIDTLSSTLPKLTTFILPGGSVESSYLHMSRVVCRRAERLTFRYWKKSGRKDLSIVLKYLNRLSDVLFVLARFSNKKRGVKEITWKGSK